MERFTVKLVRYFENMPDALRKRKWLVWLLFLAATVFCVMGMGRTKFDMTVEGWFEKDDPAIVAFNGFHSQFGSEDHIFIVYRPKDGDVFSAKSLKAVKGIREELLAKAARLKEGDGSGLKHIVKITAIDNAPVLKAEGDELISTKLVGEAVPTDKRELEAMRATALSQKKFPLLYYSKDMKYGGMLVETNFGAIPLDADAAKAGDGKTDQEMAVEDMAMQGAATARIADQDIRFKPTDLKDYLALMNEIKAVLEKPEYADHLEYFPVGNAAATEYDLKMIQEMGLMNVSALFIMIFLLLLLFRSLSAVVWPITIVILSSIWTIGIAGWLGLTVTAFIMITVMLILTIGIADAVHILSGYLYSRKKGLDHRTTLRAVYKSAGLSCLLTALTTIIGILALNITPVVPIKVFSVMSAVGVALAFFFTIFLLPLMLDLWVPDPLKEGRSWPQRISSSIGRFVPNLSRMLERLLAKVPPVAIKGRSAFLSAFLLILAICVYGATKVRVDTNPLGQYPKDSKIRESVAIVDQKMMGSQNLEIYLDLGRENAFHDPMVLRIMDRLQQKIERDYDLVIRTSSLVDVVKDSYQKLNEGKEEMYAIPEDQKVLSQALFLFNNANPEDRKKLVSDNYDRAHISVMLHNTGSAKYAEVFATMQEDFDEAFAALKQKYPDARITITGLMALMMKAADYMTWAEIQSFGIALVVISIVLLAVFGSLRGGLIALIPNLIPATLTFGLMGLLGIPLDFQTMMLAPIIIGIAIDDTVHFITAYRTQVLLDGNIRRALDHTIRETGQAILFTALILGLGFGIMSFASASGTSNMGRFGALAMAAGLLCDLFLLPALIMTFRLTFKAGRPGREESVPAETSKVLANG